MDNNDPVILLVEDNPMDVELTLNALEREVPNFRVHIARDGDEALEFMKQLEGELPTVALLPKLILLDLKIPKIAGLDVLRAIKENPVTRIIPVVVLTSSRDEEDMLKSYSLGANSYIQKPVSFDEFRKLVQQLGSYWLEANLLPSPTVVRRQFLQPS